jgi:hypothetical protein
VAADVVLGVAKIDEDKRRGGSGSGLGLAPLAPVLAIADAIEVPCGRLKPSGPGLVIAGLAEIGGQQRRAWAASAVIERQMRSGKGVGR